MLERTGEKTLYQQLADQLQQQIEQGTLVPGDRLPSVRKLQQQFDVSLTTVLEALRVLESRGLILVRPQSGHYVKQTSVARLEVPSGSTPPNDARKVQTNMAIRLNTAISPPNKATLGSAVQGPELMPIAAINRLLSQVMRQHGEVCHAYDAPPGYLRLRQEIARRGSDAGYQVRPDQIVITSGAKEAVYLSIRAVTRPGDTVAIQSPAYYALLEVLESIQLKVVEIASHPATGISLDDLDKALSKYNIAACAMVSNFSNPIGSCMPDENKRKLVEMLHRYDVPLVEDDVYGELAFDGPRPKAIKAFDQHGLVLYCSSFSKTLSPGLRVGWAIPGRYQQQLELLKLCVNQATATAPQLALASFLESGAYDRHLRKIRRMYHQQMEQMLRAIQRHFPSGTKATHPCGGHVLWVELPAEVDSLKLSEQAFQQGIRIAPGPLFSAAGLYRNCLRINTGFPWTDELDEKVRQLGQLIQQQIEIPVAMHSP